MGINFRASSSDGPWMTGTLLGRILKWTPGSIINWQYLTWASWSFWSMFTNPFALLSLKGGNLTFRYGLACFWQTECDFWALALGTQPPLCEEAHSIRGSQQQLSAQSKGPAEVPADSQRPRPGTWASLPVIPSATIKLPQTEVCEAEGTCSCQVLVNVTDLWWKKYCHYHKLWVFGVACYAAEDNQINPRMETWQQAFTITIQSTLSYYSSTSFSLSPLFQERLKDKFIPEFIWKFKNEMCLAYVDEKGQGNIDFSRLHSNGPILHVELNFCSLLWKIVQGYHDNLNACWVRNTKNREQGSTGPFFCWENVF